MIPNLLSKRPLPAKIPEGMRASIAQVRRARTRSDAVRIAYDILSARYHGERFKTYLFFHRLFSCDAQELWRRSGYLHCHHIDYLLRILLVGSGKFRDDELAQRLSLVWYVSPHQYLRVATGKRTIDVDVWAKALGVPYGHHATGLSYNK